MVNEGFRNPLAFAAAGLPQRKLLALELTLVAVPPPGVPELKFLSRFVRIESSPATSSEYWLIAWAMAFALLAIMPIVANSLSVLLGN